MNPRMILLVCLALIGCEIATPTREEKMKEREKTFQELGRYRQHRVRQAQELLTHPRVDTLSLCQARIYALIGSRDRLNTLSDSEFVRRGSYQPQDIRKAASELIKDAGEYDRMCHDISVDPHFGREWANAIMMIQRYAPISSEKP